MSTQYIDYYKKRLKEKVFPNTPEDIYWKLQADPRCMIFYSIYFLQHICEQSEELFLDQSLGDQSDFEGHSA